MNRISEIDLLRGVALLGIFLMNIIAMGLPLESYSNPYAFDAITWGSTPSDHIYGRDVLNNVFFSVMHVFVDQKMMGLFSLLFGASTLLFLRKLKEKQQGVKLYFYRNMWLILFGIAHGVFLFFGDILFVYGVCAFFLVLFSRLKSTLLLYVGLFFYCAPIVMQLYMHISIVDFSPEQIRDLHDLWFPPVDEIQNGIDYYVDTPYVEQVLTTIGYYGFEEMNQMWTWYWDALTIEGFARSFGMMLIGMSFFAKVILPNASGATSEKGQMNAFYKEMQRIGFGLGLPIIFLGLYLNYNYQWEAAYSAVAGRLLNHIGTPLVVCAYIATIILWSRNRNDSNVHRFFQLRIQAVGRMAFTNYIMQSIVGLILFMGVVFSFFATFQRWELFGIVLLTWCIQLCFSFWWMNRFKYGPLEWCWRCLTYGQLINIKN